MLQSQVTFVPPYSMNQSKSQWFHLIYLSLLPVLGPRLEVLQSVQGGVMGAQWIRHRGFAQGLLEGGLLQLQDQAIGLLTLRLPLLGCLSPEGRQEE